MNIIEMANRYLPELEQGEEVVDGIRRRQGDLFNQEAVLSDSEKEIVNNAPSCKELIRKYLLEFPEIKEKEEDIINHMVDLIMSK